MKKFVIGAIAVVFLGGCQTAGPLWKSVDKIDEFTDVNTKMVTIGEYSGGSLIVTRSLRYYPFVGIQDGEMFVGVRSGGRYRVPTGTVQIRIDENPVWTISPEETPISHTPSVPTMPATAVSQQADYASLQAQTMQNITKMMSPYTAATGNKAKDIVRQMIVGKVVKFRAIGMNQAALTTGEVVLDASFIDALKSIGIDPSAL